MSNGVCSTAIAALGSVIIFLSGSPASGDDARLVSISYSNSSSDERLEEKKDYAYNGGYLLKDYAQPKKIIKKITPDKEKGKKNSNPYNIDRNKRPSNPYKNYKKNSVNYKVNKGDTLFSISRKFEIPFSVLCSLNDFSGDEKIKAGAVIRVPESEKNEDADNSVNERPAKDNPARKVAFEWPVKNVKNFRQDGSDGIKPLGIIITGNPGAKVFPSADGVVQKIGSMRGFGKYVVVKHDGKFVTVYSNLDKISVAEGQRLTTKSSIGKMDQSNGKLHFQIDYAGKPKNPASYLPAKS